MSLTLLVLYLAVALVTFVVMARYWTPPIPPLEAEDRFLALGLVPILWPIMLPLLAVMLSVVGLYRLARIGVARDKEQE